MATLQQDFTQGNVGKLLVRFSLPFLLSNFIQACYNVADMFIVSMYNGAESLSGVNIGGQITNIVVMLTIGLAQGGTVLVAQYFGAKKLKDVSDTIGTILSFLMLLSIGITVVMLALSQPILRLIQTPVESFSEALAYLRICLMGNIFIFGYNAVSAIQRGMGDSKRPLVFVSIACVINIGLDLLFVGPFGMGAAGAALATVISQGTSMLMAMVYLHNNKFVFDFKLKSFRIHWDKVKLIFRIGLPSGVQGILVNLSFLLMTALVNGFGVFASAAVGVVGKFNSFAIMPANAMSMSVSSMSAQNIGAGAHDRAKRSLYYGIGIAFTLGLIMFLISQFFPAQIIGIFSDEVNVIDPGVAYLRGFSFDYLLVPFTFCMMGLINGSGHTTFSLFSGLLTSVLLRVPLAWILSRTSLGLTGIGLAAPLATLGGVVLCSWFIVSGRWMRNVTGIGNDIQSA